jgi:HD-like signal output (HDOD) protein
LIHDIGKLLIERHLNPEAIQELRRLTGEGGLTYIQAENEVLGTDHAFMGGAIARHWKFPGELVLAIEHHHDPHPKADPLLDAVQVANSVAKLLGIGLGSEQMNFQPDAEGPVRLGLTATALESLCATVMDQLQETEAMWDMKPKFY